MDGAKQLRPPDHGTDPHHWRWVVFWCLVLIIPLTLTHIATATFGAEWFGIARYARADEVDEKIAKAITPIETKISGTQRTMDSILKAIYLPQVRQKVRERCDTKDARERQKINVELDRIKTEYRTLSGNDFGTVPSCNEV